MTGPTLITIDELKEIAHGQTRTLCQHLLPNGRENSGYWEVGSIEGEKGQSLKVNLQGPMRGMWTDFSAAKGASDRAGNMIQLAALVRFGGDVGDAVRWLKSWCGLDGMDPKRLATEKAKATRQARKNIVETAQLAEKNRRRAHEIYLSAVPIAGTLAETYLCSRAIDLRAAGLAAPGALRFHDQVYCTETRSKLPAMVSTIVNLAGHHVGTHRTYLAADGKGKALLVEPKKVMGKFGGGFIPLWKGEHDCSMGNLPPGVPIYVSEGIEDGLSVAITRPSLRIIAAVSLGNIGGLELNPKNPIYLLAQRDEKLRAIEAFEVAVARLEERGHDVYLIYPPDGVKDYNELLTLERGGVK